MDLMGLIPSSTISLIKGTKSSDSFTFKGLPGKVFNVSPEDIKEFTEILSNILVNMEYDEDRFNKLKEELLNSKTLNESENDQLLEDLKFHLNKAFTEIFNGSQEK